MPAGTSPPAPSGGASAATEPRRIKTIPIRSDQVASSSAAEPPAAAPPVAAPPPTQPAARSEPRAGTAATAVSAGSFVTWADVAHTRRSCAYSQRGTATAGIESAATGGYVVQLAAQKDPRGRFGLVPIRAGKISVRSERSEDADPPEGSFRCRALSTALRLAPFASRSDAVHLCENLKSAGGTCIVQRN